MSSAFYDALLIATQSAVEDSWLKTEVRCWDFSAMRLVSFPSCVFAQCMSWNMWKLSVWCWERLFQAVRPHGYYFKLSDRMMIISSCPTAWWLLQAVRPHDAQLLKRTNPSPQRFNISASMSIRSRIFAFLTPSFGVFPGLESLPFAWRTRATLGPLPAPHCAHCPVGQARPAGPSSVQRVCVAWRRSVA